MFSVYEFMKFESYRIRSAIRGTADTSKTVTNGQTDGQAGDTVVTVRHPPVDRTPINKFSFYLLLMDLTHPSR